MDAKTSLQLNSLISDLHSLEQKEASLVSELEEVSARIKLLKEDISKINKSDTVTTDILQKVYEQRRSPGSK